MMTTIDRRQESGVAIVTVRSSVKRRYDSAGVPNGVYAVQNGNTWPDSRPPLVLDTIGMSVQMLVELLANPPTVKNKLLQPISHLCSDPQANTLQEKPQFVPLIALADPHDWRALRLLKLCPTVQLVCPDDPGKFRRWLVHFDSMVFMRSDDLLNGWLVDPAPDLKLDCQPRPHQLGLACAGIWAVCLPAQRGRLTCGYKHPQRLSVGRSISTKSL